MQQPTNLSYPQAYQVPPLGQEKMEFCLSRRSDILREGNRPAEEGKEEKGASTTATLSVEQGRALKDCRLRPAHAHACIKIARRVIHMMYYDGIHQVPIQQG